jgi:hypothetical protein
MHGGNGKASLMVFPLSGRRFGIFIPPLFYFPDTDSPSSLSFFLSFFGPRDRGKDNGCIGQGHRCGLAWTWEEMIRT